MSNNDRICTIKPHQKTEYIVRSATPGDAQGIIDMLNPIIRDGGTTAIEIEIDLGEQSAYLAKAGPRNIFIVAVNRLSGEITGFQYVEDHHDLPKFCGDIGTFVKRENGRRGIASTLNHLTFAKARSSGFVELNATIRADNISGLEFYEHSGFHTVSIMPRQPLRNGEPVDRINKRLTL
ncbi:MAG: GNAT family N-acetyltransferase [Cohaesibacteraceae bacterium]|nr:GNAT family N-acetyltransferase [Cohaesibacteraceae bacterium]